MSTSISVSLHYMYICISTSIYHISIQDETAHVGPWFDGGYKHSRSLTRHTQQCRHQPWFSIESNHHGGPCVAPKMPWFHIMFPIEPGHDWALPNLQDLESGSEFEGASPSKAFGISGTSTRALDRFRRCLLYFSCQVTSENLIFPQTACPHWGVLTV